MTPRGKQTLRSAFIFSSFRFEKEASQESFGTTEDLRGLVWTLGMRLCAGAGAGAGAGVDVVAGAGVEEIRTE